jgi:hypothetical protein
MRCYSIFSVNAGSALFVFSVEVARAIELLGVRLNISVDKWRHHFTITVGSLFGISALPILSIKWRSPCKLSVGGLVGCARAGFSAGFIGRLWSYRRRGWRGYIRGLIILISIFFMVVGLRVKVRWMSVVLREKRRGVGIDLEEVNPRGITSLPLFIPLGQSAIQP